MITDRPNVGSYFVGLSFSQPFSVIGEYRDFAGGEKLDGSPILDVSNFAVTTVENTDGSVDLNVTWAWDNDGVTATNDNSRIDGFRLFAAVTDQVMDPTDDGFNDYIATGDAALYIDLDASARSYRAAGVAADKYYTFGIYAYRIVFADTPPAPGALKDSNVIRSSGEFLNSFKPMLEVLINGTPVSVMTSAVHNFNVNNDRNPVTPKAPYGITYESFPNIDGSVDLELSWYFTDTYTGDDLTPDSDIDGFRLIAIGNTTAYNAPSLDHNYTAQSIVEVPFNKNATLNRHTYRYRGVPIDLYYTIGVYAYRVIDTDVIEMVAPGHLLGNCVVSSTVQYPAVNAPAFQISDVVNYQGSIGGVPADNYTTLANNYFNANDRISTIPNGPGTPTITTTIEDDQNPDGSSDVTITWNYTYQFANPTALAGTLEYNALTGATDIDGFRIVMEHSNSSFTCASLTQKMVTSAFTEIRSTRGLELTGVRKTLDGSGQCTVTYTLRLPGFPSNHKLCVGVFAYRVVAPDVLDNIGSASRIVDAVVSNVVQYPSPGQAAHAVGVAPNFWGRVAGTQAVDLLQTANDAAAQATWVQDVVNSMVSDNQLSPIEKQSFKSMWDTLLAEKPNYQTQSTAFSLATSFYNDYVTAMNVVGTILNRGIAYTSGYPIMVTTDATHGLAVISDLTAITDGTLLAAKVNTLLTKRVLLATEISNSLRTFASSAQTTADNAYNVANNVDDAVLDIISDSKLTPNEKTVLRSSWDIIAAEKSVLEAQAVVFGVTTQKTTYTNTVVALGTYLNNGVTWSSGIPSWITDANLSVTTDIVGATMRQKTLDYTTARTALLNQIAEVARGLAQSATDKIADMESDGKITPVEKQEIRRIWNSYYAEYSSLITLGSNYGVPTERTNYINALTNLGTYLNGAAYTISSTVPVYINDATLTTTTNVTGSTLRSYFAAFEAARTALINAFTGVANLSASSALSKVSDMESDGIITPVEKATLRSMWDAYYAEYSSLVNTASTFGVSSTTYANALVTLGTTLNGSAYTLSATPPTYINNTYLTSSTTLANSTIRSDVSSIESARTALVNNFAVTSRAIGITAQNTADTKLNADAADILSGTIAFSSAGGFKTGTISIDSSGNATGAGVAFTSKGIVGRSASAVTFTINATTGDATFNGDILTDGDAKFYGKTQSSVLVNIDGTNNYIDYSVMAQATTAPAAGVIRGAFYGYAEVANTTCVAVMGKSGTAAGKHYGVVGEGYYGVVGVSRSNGGGGVWGIGSGGGWALYGAGPCKFDGLATFTNNTTAFSIEGFNSVACTPFDAGGRSCSNFMRITHNGNTVYIPLFN